MDPNGDITDAFDDDLAQSIEKGREGPWNDESAIFNDPKLKELQAKLKKPQERDYKTRRLEELQQRAMESGTPVPKKPRSKPKPNSEETTTNTSSTQWGQELEWNDGTTQPEQAAQPALPAEFSESPSRAEPFDPTPEPNHPQPEPSNPTPEASNQGGHPSLEQSALVQYAPSVFAATFVFVAATIVHGALDGWHIDLIVRTVIALSVTGFLWRHFQAGRLRAMAIAAAVYAFTFVPSDRLEEPQTVFALFLGLLCVLAGSGLAGVQRDEFGN